MSQVQCGSCGRQVPPDATQCPYCGAAQSATPQSYAVPHRGVTVLVLGILGLVVCFAFGIAAWIMGNRDLSEMDAGRMDRSGSGMTQGGRICGMVSVGLAVLGLVVGIILMALGMVLQTGS